MVLVDILESPCRDEEIMARRKNPSLPENAYYTALASSLAALRALKYVAWNAHWTSRNEWAYGDHLLYQRIYAGEDDEGVLDGIIDTLGEKLVHLKGDDFIQSPEIVEAYIGIIRSYGVTPTGRPVAAVILEMVMICMSHIKEAYEAGQTLNKGILTRRKRPLLGPPGNRTLYMDGTYLEGGVKSPTAGAKMSLGMDDFLMASSNQLETFAYLLQQKIRR